MTDLVSIFGSEIIPVLRGVKVYLCKLSFKVYYLFSVFNESGTHNFVAFVLLLIDTLICSDRFFFLIDLLFLQIDLNCKN